MNTKARKLRKRGGLGEKHNILESVKWTLGKINTSIDFKWTP